MLLGIPASKRNDSHRQGNFHLKFIRRATVTRYWAWGGLSSDSGHTCATSWPSLAALFRFELASPLGKTENGPEQCFPYDEPKPGRTGGVGDLKENRLNRGCAIDPNAFRIGKRKNACGFFLDNWQKKNVTRL